MIREDCMNGGYKLRLEGVGMLSRCRSKGSILGEGNSSCKCVDTFTNDIFYQSDLQKSVMLALDSFYIFKTIFMFAFPQGHIKILGCFLVI